MPGSYLERVANRIEELGLGAYLKYDNRPFFGYRYWLAISF
jgi:hypothetical protein